MLVKDRVYNVSEFPWPYYSPVSLRGEVGQDKSTVMYWNEKLKQNDIKQMPEKTWLSIFFILVSWSDKTNI